MAQCWEKSSECSGNSEACPELCFPDRRNSGSYARKRVMWGFIGPPLPRRARGKVKAAWTYSVCVCVCEPVPSLLHVTTNTHIIYGFRVASGAARGNLPTDRHHRVLLCSTCDCSSFHGRLAIGNVSVCVCVCERTRAWVDV